jgi:hypothetical protein
MKWIADGVCRVATLAMQPLHQRRVLDDPDIVRLLVSLIRSENALVRLAAIEACAALAEHRMRPSTA